MSRLATYFFHGFSVPIMLMRILLIIVTGLSAYLPTVPCQADELILEDYEGGGEFDPGPWANSFKDSEGNTNSARHKDSVAIVHWATKWSGLSSTGPVVDVSKFTTFQVDVMVEKGQPVQDECYFFFQLLNKTSRGYSYWEVYVPQNLVPADGKWHRVKFPLSRMDKGYGDGGVPPGDFKTIFGTQCGMTFDEPEDQFKFKRANFDNLTLTDEEITETTVKLSPKTVNPPPK